PVGRGTVSLSRSLDCHFPDARDRLSLLSPLNDHQQFNQAIPEGTGPARSQSLTRSAPQLLSEICSRLPQLTISDGGVPKPVPREPEGDLEGAPLSLLKRSLASAPSTARRRYD